MGNKEKDLVNDIISWAASNKIKLRVYDSKAKKTAYGFYRVKDIEEGHPDLGGYDNYGYVVYVEAKNKGKYATAKQRDYLFDVITYSGFAFLAYDIGSLDTVYNTWLKLKRQVGDKEASDYLKEKLPNKVLVNKKVIKLENL